MFLNPGKSDPNDPTGGFWRSVSSFMEAAARDLAIELETLYSERDRVLMAEQAAEVVARKHPPDYLVVVNEQLAAASIVQAADKAGIKTFVMHNRFYGEQAIMMGEPRRRYAHWIGSLSADNHWAGYQLAKRLLLEARNGAGGGAVDMLALAGDYVTQASLERTMGMQHVLAEFPKAELKQMVVCHWRKDRAREVILGLLDRYAHANVVWAANDPIALGAVDGALMRGRRPGRDIFIGGMNWDLPALRMIRKGLLTASVGGHFMIGGWTLVLIRDYDSGIDFAEHGNAQLTKRIFGMLDAQTVDQYLQKFGTHDWDAIDFKRFSKAYTPSLREYDFSVEALMRQ